MWPPCVAPAALRSVQWGWSVQGWCDIEHLFPVFEGGHFFPFAYLLLDQVSQAIHVSGLTARMRILQQLWRDPWEPVHVGGLDVDPTAAHPPSHADIYHDNLWTFAADTNTNVVFFDVMSEAVFLSFLKDRDICRKTLTISANEGAVLKYSSTVYPANLVIIWRLSTQTPPRRCIPGTCSFWRFMTSLIRPCKDSFLIVLMTNSSLLWGSRTLQQEPYTPSPRLFYPDLAISTTRLFKIRTPFY